VGAIREFETAVIPVPLRIIGEQTIRNVDLLQEAFSGYLDGAEAVAVDLSEVKACDAAALQLIYALRHSAIQRKLPFQITAVSPAIVETAAALGFEIDDLMIVCAPATADGHCDVAGQPDGI